MNVRPTGRRCSSGRHFRSFCLFSLPWAGALDPVIQVRILEGQLTVCGVAAPNWARRAGFSCSDERKSPTGEVPVGLDRHLPLDVGLLVGRHHACLTLHSRASMSPYSRFTAAVSVTPRNWMLYPWGPWRITNGYKLPGLGCAPPMSWLDTLGA